MRKIIPLIGLALLLSACDGHEKTDIATDSVQTPTQAELAQAAPAVENGRQESETSQAKPAQTEPANAMQAVSTEEKLAKNDGMTNEPKSVEGNDLATEKVVESADSALTINAAETAKQQAVKAKATGVETVTAEKAKKAQPVKEVAKQARAVKSAVAVRHYDEDASGLSEEELRVGAQKPLSIDEINHLKTQCRYPFMSDREMQLFRCFPVKVNQ